MLQEERSIKEDFNSLLQKSQYQLLLRQDTLNDKQPVISNYNSAGKFLIKTSNVYVITLGSIA